MQYLVRLKLAILPLGSGDPGDSNPAIPTTGSVAGWRSQCEQYRASIEVEVQQRLSAQRIHQYLMSGEALPDNYTSVKRFVRQLCPVSELPFRRWESSPGEVAQVDFGQGAWLVDESGRR